MKVTPRHLPASPLAEPSATNSEPQKASSVVRPLNPKSACTARRAQSTPTGCVSVSAHLEVAYPHAHPHPGRGVLDRGDVSESAQLPGASSEELARPSLVAPADHLHPPARRRMERRDRQRLRGRPAVPPFHMGRRRRADVRIPLGVDGFDPGAAVSRLASVSAFGPFVQPVGHRRDVRFAVNEFSGCCPWAQAEMTPAEPLTAHQRLLVDWLVASPRLLSPHGLAGLHPERTLS